MRAQSPGHSRSLSTSRGNFRDLRAHAGDDVKSVTRTGLRVTSGPRLSKAVRLAVFAASNWQCGLCHEPVDPGLCFPHPLSASVDHIRARADGGTEEPSNLQCAHYTCNAWKSAPLAVEAESARRDGERRAMGRAPYRHQARHTFESIKDLRTSPVTRKLSRAVGYVTGNGFLMPSAKVRYRNASRGT